MRRIIGITAVGTAPRQRRSGREAGVGRIPTWAGRNSNNNRRGAGPDGVGGFGGVAARGHVQRSSRSSTRTAEVRFASPTSQATICR